MQIPQVYLTHKSLAHVVIGVADMRVARQLWVDSFGLEIVAERPGSDPGLERLWGLPDQGVVDQLLVRTPQAQTGWLHFVQFANPSPPVRAGAAPHDLCPKNIDVNCIDVPMRFAELEAAGMRFRSAVSEYEIDGLTVR